MPEISLHPLFPKVGHCQGSSVEDQHQQPTKHVIPRFGLTDGICQGECKRRTELGRGHELFRGILEILCCFVFEMFLFLREKGRSAFLFQSTCRVTSRVTLEHITWKCIQKIPA